MPHVMKKGARRAHRKLIGTLLMAYDQPISATGHPNPSKRTRVMPHCMNSLNGFSRYSVMADVHIVSIVKAAASNKKAALPLKLAVLDQSEPSKHHPRSRVSRSSRNLHKHGEGLKVK